MSQAGLSDDELTAFLAQAAQAERQRQAAAQAGSPPPDVGYGPGVRAPDASSGRGVDVWIGSDQASAPPSPTPSDGTGMAPGLAAMPPAPQAPPPPPPPVSGDDGDKWNGASLTDGILRALARGVPVLGAWADEGNAATNAALAPVVEPAMRALDRLRVPTGYNEADRLDNKGGFGERYEQALNLQRFKDASFDAQHPAISGVGQGVGMIGGTLGTLPVLAAGSGALPAAAGLIPRMAVGGVEGAMAGGLQGFGSGTGALNSPDRVAAAEGGALFGAGAGSLFPLAAKGLGIAWDATGARALDAMSPPRVAIPENMPITREQALLDAVRQPNRALPPPGGASAPPSIGDLDIADVLARRSRTPGLSVGPRDMRQATSFLARALQRQNMSPAQAGEAIDRLGPSGVLADTGEVMRDALRTATNVPGPSGGLARAVLNGRQEGILEAGDYVARPSSQRILDAAEEGMGLSGRQYHSQFDTLDAAQKEAAGPLYAAVRDLGPVDSPKLQALLARPSVQRATARAYRIAKEQGREPEALGFVSVERPGAWDSTMPPSADDIGSVTLRAPSRTPSRGRSLLKFLADNGGITDATDELTSMDGHLWHNGKAYQRPLIGAEGSTLDDAALRSWEAGYLPEFAERPTERQFLDVMREELRGKPRFARDLSQELTDRLAARDAGEELAYRGGAVEDVPSPDQYVGRPAPVDEPAFEAQPTAETWDYIKRGLDDVLEGYRDKTTGKLVLDGEGRDIVNTLNELRGELVRLNPIYGKALKAYAGPAAMKDALQAGRDALAEDAPDLAKRFAEMGEGEQRMYRLGALQALKDKLGNTDVSFDAARRAGLLKPNQLERFREIFPDRDSFASFVQRMQDEQTMFQTRAAAQGNSSTAKQLAHAADADHGAGQAVRVAGAVAGGPLTSAAALASAIMRFGGERKLSEGGAAAATALLLRDRQGLETLAPQIEASQAKGRLSAELQRLVAALTRQEASNAAAPAQ